MKILFVGLGSIGQRHLRNIDFLYPGTKFLAYRKLNRKITLDNKNNLSKEDLNKKYNIKLFKNYNKALSDKPDAVFICNPTSHHMKYAITAVKYGINVFVDKPLSNNLKNIETLKQYLKKKNVVFMVGYQLRFNKSLNFIKKIIDKNKLGNLCNAFIYNGEYLPDYHKYEDYKRTWMAQKKLGGGVIDSQIHELDYCLYLFGRPKSIFALGGKKSHLKIDVEDYVNSIINFSKQNIAVNLSLDFLQRPPQRYLKIIGSKKTLFWDYYKNIIYLNDYVSSKQKKYIFEKFDRNKMFLDQTKYFFKLIKKRDLINKSSFENAVDGIKFSQKIKESMVKKKLISFN